MPKDPYQYYRVEARDLLESLSKRALELERAPSPELVLGELLRLAHTLKGASRVVQQLEIAELAHAIEEVLAPFRGTDVWPSRTDVDAILTLLDRVSVRIAALDPAPASAKAPPPGTESFDSVRVGVHELDQLIRGIAEAAVQAKGLRQPLSGLQQAGSLASLLQGQLSSPRFSDVMPSSMGRRLLALAEELRDELARVRRDLGLGLDHVEAELTQLRDRVEQLRLIPARDVLDAIERATRDAAGLTGKTVSFQSTGGEVKLDAHVLRALHEAMLHVVRNAVAHGIELPGERERNGKSPAGLISIAFERRGAQVGFTCRDDGRGIDVAAIVEQAKRRGLVAADVPADIALATSLLLRGGLSTKPTVTEVSGRGIGMDVVRETAQRLKGEVLFQSESGRGTTVEIRVPVSLSSVRALVVEAGELLVSLPLDAIRRALVVPSTAVARSGDRESIVLEGEVLPFVSLARLLRRAPASIRRDAFTTVVVQGGGRSAALSVERLVGTFDMMVRCLQHVAQAEPMVAGAALDADGTPRLVLDPAGLVAAALAFEQTVEPRPLRLPPRVLVIDDSLTTRMLEQSILESADYEVELATSGEEALEKAHRSHFDLFLVDVEMPGMDGFEFIRLSREDPRLQGTPSILVTSRNTAEDRERGEQVGARAYIAKAEFEQEALLQRIRELVR